MRWFRNNGLEGKTTTSNGMATCEACGHIVSDRYAKWKVVSLSGRLASYCYSCAPMWDRRSEHVSPYSGGFLFYREMKVDELGEPIGYVRTDAPQPARPAKKKAPKKKK